MRFHWVNWINLLAVVWLIAVNLLAFRKGLSDSFRSKHWMVNLLEQIGRYGCMALMVFPVFTRGWEFGFASVEEMLLWLGVTPLLLVIYSLLWVRKARGGAGVLYGLAIIPVVLFFLNGVLLRHPALGAAAVVFGTCHLIIVRENV